jgi:hypothetical protein
MSESSSAESDAEGNVRFICRHGYNICSDLPNLSRIGIFSCDKSSIIHAEALVHPAMISHPEPNRVLLISDFPFAILDELQKYDSSIVERIDVAYANPEVQEIVGRFLPTNYSTQSKIPVTFYNDLDHLPDLQDTDDVPVAKFLDIRDHESNDYTDPQKKHTSKGKKHLLRQSNRTSEQKEWQ